MKKRQRVVLYGDTLVLAGVRLSLEANLAFEVLVLDASHAEQELLDLHPDVIIFDIDSIQPQFHYDLIQQRSGLKFIGIDPDRNQVLVWSGRQMEAVAVADLINVIRTNSIQKPELDEI